MSNSINTNIAAFYAQQNITTASQAATLNVARLSSGNAIINASDNVSALAIGTSLQSQVSVLNTAQTNAAQGTSLLQVADGALAQIQSILQQQQSIANQAQSGSLTDTDRGFLNQEFQQLTAEINSLATGTQFNGVNLIDGSLSTSAAVNSTATNATAGSLSTTFTTPISVGDNININGTVMTAIAQNATASGTQFNVGSSLADTLSNLATRLNTLASNSSYNTTIGAATYSASNQTLTATANAGGSLSNTFVLGGTAPSASNGIAATKIKTTNASAAVQVKGITNASSDFAVGQNIIVNPASAAGVKGISAQLMRGIITAVTSTSVTFTAGASATGATSVANAAKVSLDMANGLNEANTNGGSVGTSFNLFQTSTGWTSSTSQISASTSTAADAFQNGDTLTATVNGITSNLYTFGTNATLNDLVNGINANTSTTGFSAQLVYNGSTYNVQLNYAGTAGDVLINGGTNYYTGGAATNKLTGNNYSSATGTAGVVGGATFTGKSLVSAGYIDLTGAAGSAGITATSVTAVATIAAVPTTAKPFVIGENLTVALNGVTENLHTFTATDTLNSIVQDINTKTASTGVYAAIFTTGASKYNIRLYTSVPDTTNDQVIASGGPSEKSTLVSTVDTLTTSATLGGLTQVYNASTAGGLDNGLAQGGTTITGTVGDNVLQSLGTTKANASILFTANASANDYITVAGQKFYFTNTTTDAAPNEILIGSTTQGTINNAVSTINKFLSSGSALGTTAYELNQLNVTGTANSLVFTAKGMGTVKTLTGGTSQISQNLTSGALVGDISGSAAKLDNSSSTYGVDATGVTNSAFTGTLQGFTATYDNSTSTADVSIKIGNYTYTAKQANLAVTSDTRLRFYSNTVNGQSGGYFDVQLKANEVQPFSDQSGADAVAARLNSAFSSLNFLQARQVSSYAGSGSITASGTVIGSLNGTSVSAQLANFSNQNLSAVSVTAPTGSATDATITFTINGVNYTTASGIGSTLGANQTYKLVSSADPNQFVTFTTGNTAITIASAADATAVQNALQSAFGAGTGSSSLTFQLGTTSSSDVKVSIANSQSSALFGGASLDVSTATDAAVAAAAVTAALNTITATRATVGAYETQFNFASAALQSSVQNQSAAESQLLDTNIATESTAYATNQVKLQAGISVLAQANQQTQALLKLIG